MIMREFVDDFRVLIRERERKREKERERQRKTERKRAGGD